MINSVFQKMKDFSSRIKKNTIKSLLLAYSIGIVFLVILRLLYGMPFLFLKNSLYAQKSLDINDFEQVDIEVINGMSFITETDDSQLIYTGNIRNLCVQCDYNVYPGEFICFYNYRGNYSFGLNRVVYAKQYGDYYIYTFPIGTKQIRFDQGVVPSVRFDYKEITLNRQTAQDIFRYSTSDLFWWFVTVPAILICFVTVTDLMTELESRRKNKYK